MQQSAKDVKVIRPTKGLYGDKKLRVAAYCRISTDSDNQEDSFIAQVKYYNDFLRLSDNMELVDIYADEGITGTSINKRDDFNRMKYNGFFLDVQGFHEKGALREIRQGICRRHYEKEQKGLSRAGRTGRRHRRR